MKKTFTYQFITSLLLLVVLSIGEAWGDSKTWTYQNGEDGLSGKTPISVTYGDGNASTSTQVSGAKADTRYLRLYASRTDGNGGWVTFTAATGYQITAIEVSFKDNRTVAYGKIDSGDWENVFSAGSSTTITIPSLTATSYSIKNGQNTGNSNKNITIKSITITYSSSCNKSVAVIDGGSSTNGTITSITTSPVATCSSTAADRRVSILVTPSTGYVAPTDLSTGSTTGTVNSSKVSRTDNGNGTFTFVYGYNQNDNGTISYNAACVGKQCTLIFNQNSGTGGQTSNLTATYGSAMPAISGVPTREHYDFEGYYDGAGGTGNKYYNSDGTSATNWNKNTTANTTLYAKWTEHGLKNYRTVCCTELGTIDGEATLTQGGNSVTISGWSDVSNVGTYTVKLYKKNGASWDLVSGTTSGGSAGAQGTRTGITSGSKSVTYTGLEVESEYKFTVQAIAGSAAYCDGAETAVTEINEIDVSSSPFKFRYAIYIDDGTNDNYDYYYIEPTGNTDEGSVDIDLSAHVDSYQFKIAGGFSGWWGQTGTSKIPASTEWELDGSNNVRLNTGAGGTYTFTVDYSSTNPAVTVTFPSADQDAGYVIYYDNSVLNWGSLYYRIGNNSSCSKVDVSLVPGTDKFYKVTTPDFDNMDAWHLANNYGWTGSNSIYRTKTSSDPAESPKAITNSIAFQQYAVTEDITVIPTSTHSTGSDTGDAGNSNCEFYTINTPTSGMLTHTATITTPSHGTITIAYTDVSGTSQSKTATTAGLAHRTILTITATPATGYTCTSLTVNGAAFTSGSTHILAADATIAATFTAQTSTVTLDNNSATSGSQQTVTATYDATMPLKTTADGTPAVAALTRTGYTFNGWWDNTSGGNQYYTYSGSPKVIASARTWDKTGAQTLKAQWIVNQYTLTWDLQGGTVATAGTGAAAAATGTPSSSQDYGTALTAPVVTKTGYNFNVWSPSVAGTMPAANTTYTASWTAQVYNITYKDQGDNAYSGNVTEGVPTGAPTTHTYGSATALVDGVKDGYRFDGWFTDASCTVSAGSSIGATAKTADFTLYAKWTQVYTVTWSVNGETWSSGVVEGNTHVPGSSKVSALPTAPTSSDCDDAKVFVGWRATAIDGTSTSDPGGIFTNVAGSPEISADKTFYAVFADGNEGTATLTNDEISAAYCSGAKDAGCGAQTSYGNGPYTIPSDGGDWEDAVCAINSNNIAMRATDASAVLGRPHLISPDYGAAVKRITINATNGSGTSRYIYICSSSTATPNTVNIGSGTATNNTTTNVVIEPTSAVSSFYVYVNDALTFNSITVEYGTPSNYVTSCSSCDEDATFTNTTPAVSDIDCTSATLTATGGLATVGADGCHVSDYGFVIGTSDNPVIGGSGVEKLQVGTSDPTIGEDFSYEATDLTKGTHYYIRAYAINRHGTAYSSSQNFWTKNVSSIAVTTAPTKTNYIVGETFDATEMVVTATMASGATEDVTSDVTYSSSALTAGTSQNFAINYTLCETEKSVNQVINVYTLAVTEGTNPSYGTATNSSANIVNITGLGDHKTYTVTVTSSNATAVDNGDNTWSIINPTGNVTVRVDYADAVQVKVYYKVDGVTVTGLTRDVYQSETTTLPTASELATAMTAQSMDLPDDAYPNFVGWSETEFSSQTSEPSLVTGTPVINAEKTYYAVYTNLNVRIIDTDNVITSSSYPGSEQTKTVGSVDFKYHYILNGNYSGTHYLQFKSNSTDYGRIYNSTSMANLIKLEAGYYNSESAIPVYACSAAGTITGSAISAESHEGSDPYVYTFPSNTSYFMVKGDNSTVYKPKWLKIYYCSSTVYYMTQFCTNRVTLTQNSPEHGTVEFGRSSLVTCGSDKEVSLTIIPDVGYQLTGWTVNTATGYADAKTTSPAVVTNSNNSAAQNITLTFAEDSENNYDVTATFGLMTVSSWAWTLNSAAIPDPLNLYVGQSARLDVAYTPAGVDNSKKTYERTKVDAYINWVGGLQATYSTISGKASTGENTTAVTFTHADGPTTTVNVKVLPLPLVHFGDIVHNVEFADVVATLSDNTLSPTKTTPTHADFDGSTANTCEEQHLHLVGWIREDWPALVNYLNGTGDAPTTVAITGAGDDASGNAYFFAPGASINTQTFNGVTFYAVWAKVE